MNAPPLSAIRRLLLAASLPLFFAAAAHGAPGVPARDFSPESFLARGMPISARREFLALSPASRAKSPVLPKIMGGLAEAGHAGLALSLFEEARPLLAEPARSEAYLSAGKILLERKEYEKAAEAFRQVSVKSVSAPRAAFHLARLLGAAGNAAGASQALSPVPRGARRSLLAGEIEMIRQNPSDALAAWAGAGFSGKVLSLVHAGGEEGVRSLKSIVDNTPAEAFPERMYARKALAFSLLRRKEYDGALSAAREALASFRGWKAAAEKPQEWDGSREGAARAWKSLAALFPYDEDAGKFLSGGRAFRATTALLETVRASKADVRDTFHRAGEAKEGVSLGEKTLAGKIKRAGEMRVETLARKRKTLEMRSRLRNAAGSLSVPAWGSRIDPRRAALIEEADRKLKALRDRIVRTRAGVTAATGPGRSDSLPPEDRRMLFYAQQRVGRAENDLSRLDGRVAFLRGKLWNRWKAEYVARLSILLDKTEAVAKAADVEVDRVDKTLLRLRAEHAELSAWMREVDLFRKRLVENRATLERRETETRAAADRSLSMARRELLSAISRDERGAAYLAARAATESRIEDSGGPPGSKSLAPSRRADLLSEAIRHWEAILPSRGEPDRLADETLYALAELRFEEAESRFLQKEGDGRGVGDYSASLSLFRRVIDEYPAGPYAEPACYGLALSWQEAGAVDNATAAMKELLSRFPGTRYADEIHLRLGEYAFDDFEFRSAEESYRKISPRASPEIRVTALFKLGWSIFLQGRPGESVEPFLSALLLSPAAGKTGGGVPGEAMTMTARSLVEAGMEKETETLLARQNASAHGPALLLQVQRILDGQNRYDEAAAVADRIGKAYPAAAERLDAEIVAAEALRKVGKEAESHARRGRFHRVFGPGSAWQTSAARAPQETVRANAVAEEGLRSAAFYLHARSRQTPPGDRQAVLALYDSYLSIFSSSPKAEEISYQRAWLLFEDGRKKEAGTAFEGVALRPGGARGETSWYMAVQCAKDVSSPADAGSQSEVVRLCLEYERFFPGGERLYSILMDRARAHVNLRRFDEAAKTSDRAVGLAKGPSHVRASLRLAADARFEGEEFEAAENAFRALLKAGPPPEEAKEAEKWVAFSMFRRAEKVPAEKSAEAAALFSRVDLEFPSLDIAPIARFRAGASYAAAGKNREAIAAFLSLESPDNRSPLSLDSTRWLARLYEKTGDPLAAAARYERLSGSTEATPQERIKILLKAADLFSMGKDELRSRKILLAIASLPGVPRDLRVECLYRAGESARTEGMTDEADRHYEETVAAYRAAPETSAAIAGKALFRRAEFRFGKYRPLAIAPPLEKTFEAKQVSLGGCAKLYLEAISLGDAETVSASLHRLGEAFEDFRSAILASPPPKKLSEREREEYAFLLEEKAAPIEEKAMEAYRRNLRQAVAAEYYFDWVGKSLQRLKSMRPALFGKKGEYAFPVVTVPDFRGMIERIGP